MTDFWAASTGIFVALLAGGGIAAVAGFFQGWLSSREAEKRDARRFDHEWEMARQERRQRRLAEAYVDLLELVERIALWAGYLQTMARAPGDPRPDPPDLGEQARVEARVRAYGSPEVRALLGEWRGTIREIVKEDLTVRIAQRLREERGQTTIDDDTALLRILEELIPAEQEQRDALADRVVVELDTL